MSKSEQAVAEAPNDVKMETRNVNVFYGSNQAIQDVDLDIAEMVIFTVEGRDVRHGNV